MNLDPRPYAAWKRSSRPRRGPLRRATLSSHALAVMVAAWRHKPLIPNRNLHA